MAIQRHIRISRALGPFCALCLAFLRVVQHRCNGITARVGQVQKMSRHLKAFQPRRSEEHTSELQSLMRISYAVFCLKKKTTTLCIPLKTHIPKNRQQDIYSNKSISKMTIIKS